MKLSLVIPFRNRDLGRVTNLVASFRAKHPELVGTSEVVLSDYGSTIPTPDAIDKIAIEYRIRVIRSATAGLPWSCAHAINNGVRAAIGEWICVVDVDMVFLDPTLDKLLQTADQSQAVFLESIWPQNPTQSWKQGRRHQSPGVFLFVHRVWFERLNGLDEGIEFWGGEDDDWLRRIKRAGVEIVWRSSREFRLVHTWHPWRNNPVQRPTSAVWATVARESANQIRPLSQPDWGRTIPASERPILGLLAETKRSFIELDVESGQLIDIWPKVYEELTKGGLIRLDLGVRKLRRKLDWLQNLLGALNRLWEAVGVEVRPLVNHNLETFLVSRPALSTVLWDYFLEENMRVLWLLGRPT